MSRRVVAVATLLVASFLPVASPARAAEDPLIAQQWGIASIEAKAAWPTSRGAGVTIAIIDSGSGPHPDLDVNLLGGRSMFAGSDVGGGTDVDDVKGHGSHVAGIAAAVAGNGIGGAGVAPNARILPIQVLNAAGSGDGRDVGRAIRFAVDSGARVINLSLGGDQESPSIAAAVQYAASKGALVVAAAGNGGPSAGPKWPAADDATIAVTAIDQSGAPSSFSQRGAYIDLAAPGSAVLSTSRGQYEYLSGSSMAAAFVSGVAALLLSARPELTAVEVRQILEASASDAGAPGRDEVYGAGIVNARAAINELAVRYPGIGAPIVAGEPRVGQALSVVTSKPGPIRWWRCTRPGDPAPVVPRGCTAITRATRPTYRPTAADLRSHLRVSVGGTLARPAMLSETTPRVVALWPLSTTIAAGSQVAIRDLVATASKGRLTARVTEGSCSLNAGVLTAPAEATTCRLQITVAARSPFPRLQSAFPVLVELPAG
jgi:hypothetical protein